MLMVTDSGRQNGARVAKGRKEKRKGGKRKKKAAGGRADRDSHKIDSLCASPPRHRRYRAPHRLCVFPLSFSPLFPLPPLSHSLSLSPNFVANLRATKSAPFDFTLIRCRCRAVDEANLSLYVGQGPKGISFSAVRAIPSPAALFQGNHFPLTLRLGTRHPLSLLCFFAPSSLSAHPALVHCSLFLSLSSLYYSPLFSTTILSLVTQP